MQILLSKSEVEDIIKQHIYKTVSYTQLRGLKPIVYFMDQEGIVKQVDEVKVVI